MDILYKYFVSRRVHPSVSLILPIWCLHTCVLQCDPKAETRAATPLCGWVLAWVQSGRLLSNWRWASGLRVLCFSLVCVFSQIDSCQLSVTFVASALSVSPLRLCSQMSSPSLGCVPACPARPSRTVGVVCCGCCLTFALHAGCMLFSLVWHRARAF